MRTAIAFATCAPLGAALGSGSAPAGALSSSPTGDTTAAVITPPPTIAANCMADVTSQLNSWIASVPNGSVLRLAAGGCYRIEGTVLLKDRVGLTIDGNGATLRAFTAGSGTARQIQTRNHLRVWGGRDLTVRNLTVRGINTDHRYHREYAGHHAFALVGVTNALIENTTVSEVYGDFVLVQGNLYRDWRWSDGVVVRDNSFNWSGRQGLSVVGGRNVTFSGNRVHGTGITAIDIEPDGVTYYDATGFPTGSGAANVRIVDNRFSGTVGGIFFSAGGYPGRVDGVEVSRNVLDGVRFYAWVTGTVEVPRTGFTFAGNVSNVATSGPRAAFEFTYVDGAVVRGNTIPILVKTYAKLPPDKTAVGAAGVRRLDLIANDFSGAARVLQVDGGWKAWTGRPTTGVVACANKYWYPDVRYDAAC